ncbi:NADP-dependent oxidoreductase domain-containing protein [Rhypophila decipiens]|uniref:NADP-dependent oxidoreductase domain-containing protein n=1 Tax=Rhypophila decipiens TaxID=261697 RepID=A0AAN6XWP7_9PEZI|nr:NADP-dependent oxidoreductase domain-containing protein [Rhypophila decipiens]
MAPLTINSTVKLNSGYEMPLLGFGVYQTPAKVAEECVTEALKAGYRHIDSAAYYRNEGQCATAILSASSDKSLSLPRDKVFFTSKIPPPGMGYASTKKQVAKTLEVTKLGYIDLMLIHAPYGGSKARKETWKALVEAVEEGKIRSIGISNYGVHHLDELEKHIKELEDERGGKGKGGIISVGQWEIHPWMNRDDIVEWCRKRNIAVQAYSPVVRGEKFGKEPVLMKLAEKYGVSEAQVLIRWSLQKGYVPLPKSVTPERIRMNAQVYGFELSKEEVDELSTKDYFSVAWDPTVEPLEK